MNHTACKAWLRDTPYTLTQNKRRRAFVFISPFNVCNLRARIVPSQMIHRLHLLTTNAYLVKSESAAFLIDSGLPKDWVRLLQLLRAHEVEPADLKAVLHTHAHSDHVGCSKRLRDEFKLPLVMHRNELARAASGENGPLISASWLSPIARPFVVHHFPKFTPDVILDTDNLGVITREFSFPGETLFTPGHTAGSLSFILGKEAVVGDILRGSLLPWRHRGATHFFQENAERARQSVSDVLSHGVEIMHPGHFGPIEMQK